MADTINGATNRLTLSSNWLDGATTTTTNAATSNCLSYTWYPWGSNWYHIASPIRLKLSEIEHLRSVAKKDKRTRDILTKFTGCIEIEVDFDG